MNKLRVAFFSISTVVLAAMILLLWNIRTDKSEYEAYLSDMLSSRVSVMISNINHVERTLTEVIELQTITKKQASDLFGNLNCMKDRERELAEMGVRLGRVKRSRVDRVVNTNMKLTEYFKKMKEALSEEDVDPLSPAQLEGFLEFQKLVSTYKEIAKSCVHGTTDSGVNSEYWRGYFAKGIDKNFWVDLISRMDETTSEYTEYSLLNRTKYKIS